MLLLDHAIFLHVPKTGGTWVRHAISLSGVRFTECLLNGDPHADLSCCPYPNTFRFAFVRHPHELYASYWRFKTLYGWDARNEFDVECQSNTFDTFVTNVVTRHPAWCSRMFEDYVGPRGQEIEFIGRFERLVDDLVEALRRAGESFDEAAIRRLGVVNSSAKAPRPAHWNPRLLDAVAISEREAFERFGYAPLRLVPPFESDC